jgi:glycosyltransferase involved in cell wall biosynthesis
MDKTKIKNTLVVILPVYNEALILEKAVNTLVSFLNCSPYYGNMEISVVIADNNSGDKTGKIASELTRQDEVAGKIKYFFTPKSGRGNAIKEVCRTFKSDFYLYLDVDLPIDLEDIEKLIEPLVVGEVDICIVKRLGAKRPFIRRLFTRTMFEINKTLLGTGFEDIQSGAKSFNTKVVDNVLNGCKESGYFLDTEFVVKSTESGFLVKEVGATWIDKRFSERGTKIHLIQDAAKAVKAVLRIFKTLNRRNAFSLWLLFFSFLLNIGVWVYVAVVSGGDNKIPLDALKYTHITPTLIPLMAVAFAVTLRAYSGLSANLRTFGSRVAIFNFILIVICTLFSRPIFSQDVYWNLLMARGFVQNHINPYITTPNSLSFLPWSVNVGAWRDMSLSHGPLSPLIHSVGALFPNLDFALLALKLIYIVALLFCVGVYFKLIRRLIKPEKQLLYAVALILNPFVLFNILSDLHIDVFVMSALTFSYFALLNKKYLLASLAIALASGTKYLMAVNLLPIVYAMRYEYGFNVKFLKRLAAVTFIFLVTVLVMYLPFGYGKHLFSGTISTQVTVYSYSSTLPFAVLIKWLLGITPETLKVLGLGTLIASTLYLSIRRRFLEAFVFPYIILFLLGTDWLFPWYFLWMFPLLILLTKKIEIIYWVSFFLMFGIEGVGLLLSFLVTTIAYLVYRYVKLSMVQR